ncbi:MAG: tyrosine-type recombinase/integrase [Candidatus Thorarchaeota archaeon]
MSFLTTKEEWNPTPEEIIIEYEEDLKVPIRQGGGETGRRIERFYKWLIEEYINPSVDGDDVHLSPSSANTYCGAIMGFYRMNTGQRVPFQRPVREVLPRGRVADNAKIELEHHHIRGLLDASNSLREKAFILCMYEFGSDLDTLLKLDVKHIGNYDLDWATITTTRGKTRVQYISHLGPNAMRVLRTYLLKRFKIRGKIDSVTKAFKRVSSKYKGKMMKAWNQPLFVMKSRGGSWKRLTSGAIRKEFSSIRRTAGFVDEDLRIKGRQNSVVLYSLRSAFETHLALAGCPKELYDFWMGHKLPYEGAYFRVKQTSLKEYQRYWKQALDIYSGFGTDVDEMVQERLRDELAKYIGFARVEDIEREARIIAAERRMHESGGGKARIGEYEPEIIIEQIESGNLIDPLDELNEEELTQVKFEAWQRIVMRSLTDNQE